MRVRGIIPRQPLWFSFPEDSRPRRPAQLDRSDAAAPIEDARCTNPTAEEGESPAREGGFDHLFVGLTGISELAEPRPGRRTALTLPLPPPPQKN
jgi:hypothetical protein